MTLSNGLYRVTLKQKMKDIEAGFEFFVAASSTGGPDMEDMQRAFYLATKIPPNEGSNGYEYYSKLSAGNNSLFEFTKLTDWNDSRCQNQLKAQWDVHLSGVFVRGNVASHAEQSKKQVKSGRSSTRKGSSIIDDDDDIEEEARKERK